MATKSKKKTKIEIAKNEDPQEEPVTMMPEEEEGPEVGIEDLPGVGPATAEKLREAGFDDDTELQGPGSVRFEKYW